MMHKRTLFRVGALLLLASCKQAPTAVSARHESAEVATQVVLAECGPDRESCLVVAGASTVSSRARIEPGSAFGTSSLTWLLPASTTAARATVLVLFDVSGSMHGEGMASVRAAMGSFLGGLPPDRILVGVAPFESHAVGARIRATRFSTPAIAARSLAQLPKPGGNTGLYSAVREGAAMLASAGGAGKAHLIVVTDGMNDVRAGDEPGLLVGPSGLAAAIDEAQRAQVQVWSIGVGNAPDRRELAALAGSEDHAQVVTNDPLALSHVLREIGERIGENSRLVIGTAAAPPLALSALPYELHVTLWDEGVTRTIVGAWSPPLMAPPIAARRFAEHGTKDGLAGTSANLRWWRWALLFMPLGFVVLAALPTSYAVEVREPERRESSDPRENGGLRPSVREAAPRTPAEVTSSRAERIVRLPSGG